MMINNIVYGKEKNAAEAALVVMRKILTGYRIIIENNYINFSNDNNSADEAREALVVMQRFKTLRPDRLVGATPTSGAPALKLESINGMYYKFDSDLEVKK